MFMADLISHFTCQSYYRVFPSPQNMSTFETELESLLGEFHIKMKGTGFLHQNVEKIYKIFVAF